MSGKAHKKKSGRRKSKLLHAMRAAELRRHMQSGLDYSAPRRAPHVGHTRRQQGMTLTPLPYGTGSRPDHWPELGRQWLAPSARGQRAKGEFR